MNKVACYVRVSTVEQAEEGYSIGAQTDRLIAYCKARDWIIYDTYIDAGYSGSNTDRPGLKQMIHDIKNKKIDLVLVYKLDRLSRSQKDTLLLIEDVFNTHDVSFVSINENFDTSTAFGRAMIGMLSVFAQLEREQIKERSRMGRVERAKVGYFHGGGFTPIGYDYIDGELVINDYEAMQVRKVFELFLSGWPLNRIWDHMKSKYTTQHGSWSSHSSIVSIITTPIYTGKITYLGETYEGRHEGIVDEETYNKAYQRYEAVRWNKGDNKHKERPFQAKHVLTGLLICGHCEARYFAKGNYSGKGDNRNYRAYYTCYSRAKTNKELINNPHCKNKTYYQGDLDAIIIGEIKKLSFDPSVMGRFEARSETNHIAKNNALIESKVADTDKQLARILDLYQMGNLPMSTLLDRIEVLNNQKNQLLDQLVDVVDVRPKLTIWTAERLLAGAVNILENGELNEKRELVHALIDKIIIDGENLTIHWAFQ